MPIGGSARISRASFANLDKLVSRNWGWLNRFFVVFWTAWLLADGCVLFIMRGRAAVLAAVAFEARAGGGGGGRGGGIPRQGTLLGRCFLEAYFIWLLQ